MNAEFPMSVLVADKIAKMGHDVDVFSGLTFNVLRKPTPSCARDARIVYSKERLRLLFPPTYYPFAPGIVESLRQGRYDVVISSEAMQPGTILATLANAGRYELFVWQEMMFHPRYPAGFLSKAAFSFYRSRNFSCFRKMMPRTEYAMKFLKSQGVPGSLISGVVPNAVDCDAFRPCAGNDFFERMDIKSPRRPRIIMVSRIDRRKGADTFVEAAVMATRAGFPGDFILKGTGPDISRVRDISRKEGVADRIMLMEQHLDREELSNLLSSCDLCVVPSSEDLFPIIPLEALAAGLPVITTSTTHHTRTFSDGKAGAIVPPNNPNAIAGKIIEITEDSVRLRRMSEYARELALREFSTDVVASRLVHITSV